MSYQIHDIADCPTCRRKKGHRCRTLTTGKVTDTHKARHDAAARILRWPGKR